MAPPTHSGVQQCVADRVPTGLDLEYWLRRHVQPDEINTTVYGDVQKERQISMI
jgi:hypothetical protein